MPNISTLTVAAVAMMLISAIGPALAQSRPSPLRPFPVNGKANSVKISVSYQFFLEGDTKSAADQAALAGQGRRHLYELLAKECSVLLDTIASACTMNRANVNTQLRQGRGSRTREGVRVSGSATYSIKLKPSETKE